MSNDVSGASSPSQRNLWPMVGTRRVASRRESVTSSSHDSFVTVSEAASLRSSAVTPGRAEPASPEAIMLAPEAEPWELQPPADPGPWLTMGTGAALGALAGAYLGTLLAAASRGVWGLVGMSLAMSAMCCLGGGAMGFLVGCACESLWSPIAAELAKGPVSE
jgi:hypothetical protein